MKVQLSKSLKFLALGTAIACQASLMQAATITWGGTSGEYKTPGNWIGGEVPDTENGDIALIGAGNVTYTPGGDLLLFNGGTLRLDGGAFTVNATSAFDKVNLTTGGVIDIRGGAFSQGTAENLFSDSTSLWNMTSGSLTMTAGQGGVAAGSFQISGGIFTATPVVGLINAAGTISGGEFRIMRLSIAASTALQFSGGLINIDQTPDWGGYGINGVNADSYINFTAGSTGTLFAKGISAANAETHYFVNNGRIRYDGTAVGAGWDTFFDINEADGGVYITAVPEPSTVAFALFAGVCVLAHVVRRRSISRV